MIAWNDIYTQFSRNIQTMNEFCNVYIRNMKKFNELFDETRPNVNRLNEIYVDSIKVNQDMCNLYKENFDSIVKLNQQWSEIFSAPFFRKCISGKEGSTSREGETERRRRKTGKRRRTRKTSRERVKI